MPKGLLAFLLACSATAAGAETLVLKAGRLIDAGAGPSSPPPTTSRSW